jgi:DNA-binding MarR family transcriptional regulator
MIDKAKLIKEAVELQRRVNHALEQSAPDTWKAWMNLNLTIAQLKSLFFIAREGSTNFRKLAAALGVTPSNVTGIIDRLVEQGLVSRRENPEDRRELLLQTTEKGKALLTNLRESRRSHMSRILAHLSLEELSYLVQGFTALVKAAEAHKGENKDEHN